MKNCPTDLMHYPQHSPKSAGELAERLIENGLQGVDAATLAQRLSQVGYFRLKGYWYPFLAPSENDSRKRHLPFLPGTQFKQIWNDYIFDQELRALAFDGIATIEIYLKNYLTTQLSVYAGEFGYMTHEGLPKLNSNSHDECLKDLTQSYAKSSLPYIRHFKTTYKEPLPPYWMLVGCLTYGSLKRWFYEGAPTEVKRALASNLNIVNSNTTPALRGNDKILSNWLETIRVVRNMIAHHDRFWNAQDRRIQPKLPLRKDNIPDWWGNEWNQFRDSHGPAVFLTMENFLLTRGIKTRRWHDRFMNFMRENPQINASQMGFPKDWELLTLWQ